MTSIRVCLDCDHKIPSGGDGIHEVNEYDRLIGCEGYAHKEGDSPLIEVKVDPASVEKVMRWVTDHWMVDCAGEPSEDYSDAFSYIGELLEFIAAEMLFLVYKDDKDEEIVERMFIKMIEAERIAEVAIVGLIPFGYDMSEAK